MYLKIPVEFVRLIFLDRCRVVLMPFDHMAKFKFLPQFQVDHLAHPVVYMIIIIIELFESFDGLTFSFNF